MKKVAVFGSFVVDLMARSPHLPVPGETVKGSMFKMGPGGKGFNQCVAAHKAGADVVMMTKVGTDTFANVMLDTMTELNMPKDNIFITKETETGIALILVDENSSQNEIIIVPGACNTITAEEVASVENVIKECEYVLLQLEVNQDANEKIVDMANKYGCKVIMNTAPYAPMTDEFLSEAFKDAMDAKGVTSGVLGMNTNVENEALNHRIDGFRKKIAEIAPDLELTDTYYNGNDVETAQKNAENIISTYGDKLIGMYSGNNITGDGVCNAVADSNVGDKFINVAVDSDDIEIQALKNGVLDAIIVQDAYAQGYKCMENALRTLIDGKNPESKKQVNCPPVVITKDNMDDSDMQDLLDPTRLQK